MPAQAPGLEVSEKVTLAVPQLSEAVNVSALGTTSHSTVISVGNVPTKVGSVVSCTVMVCDTDDVLSHASVKVQVRVIITLQGLELSTESTPVTVISPAQLSVAVRFPAAGTSSMHS